MLHHITLNKKRQGERHWKRERERERGNPEILTLAVAAPLPSIHRNELAAGTWALGPRGRHNKKNTRSMD